MWKPRTLAQRVFLSTALGSLSAVAIVAPVTVVLANRLARNQEDEHLRSAAGTLAFELRVKHYDPVYAVNDETRELAPTAIVVTLFERGQLLAGARELPFLPAGTCQSTPQLRVCAVAAERWVVAAGRAHTRLRAHSDVTLMAAGIAAVATSVLSLILAFVLAAAAVRPLGKLSSALQRMPLDLRHTVDLGPASAVYEVETLRASLLGVFEALQRALQRSHSFAGDAAHQLRTPLAALTGELDLALEVAEDDTRPYYLRAREEAARLSRLIDRLLILAMTDDSIRAWTLVSSTDLFEEACDALPLQLRERIQHSGQIHFDADPVLLLVAIVGALENALQSCSGRVRLYAELDNENARLVLERASDSDSDSELSAGDGVWQAVWERVALLHGGYAHVDKNRISLAFAHTRSRTFSQPVDSVWERGV